MRRNRARPWGAHRVELIDTVLFCRCKSTVPAAVRALALFLNPDHAAMFGGESGRG